MDFETIPAKELNRCVRDGRVIIDLRTPEEYQKGHIKGAINRPYDQMEAWSLTLPPEEVVLYCERGALSMAAARELASRNYRVKTVVGGIQAYRGPYLVGIQ